MTKVKMCGLTRAEDIAAVNVLQPEYIGFVFVSKSKRYITKQQAASLRTRVDKTIKVVGVFADEDVKVVAEYLNCGIIDLAQLHGQEDDAYIARLRAVTDKPVIKAFRVRTIEDIQKAQNSAADMILLDAGAGDGKTFDWSLVRTVTRPYFLAGGLAPDNAGQAIAALHPFALDVSSGIETDGHKDKNKMAAFMAAVRKEEDQ